MVDFINRVSEALKGRKVNRACQAWMGWMPLALWYGALSFPSFFPACLAIPNHTPDYGYGTKKL